MKIIGQLLFGLSAQPSQPCLPAGVSLLHKRIDEGLVTEIIEVERNAAAGFAGSDVPPERAIVHNAAGDRIA